MATCVSLPCQRFSPFFCVVLGARQAFCLLHRKARHYYCMHALHGSGGRGNFGAHLTTSLSSGRTDPAWSGGQCFRAGSSFPRCCPLSLSPKKKNFWLKVSTAKNRKHRGVMPVGMRRMYSYTCICSLSRRQGTHPGHVVPDSLLQSGVFGKVCLLPPFAAWRGGTCYRDMSRSPPEILRCTVLVCKQQEKAENRSTAVCISSILP